MIKVFKKHNKIVLSYLSFVLVAMLVIVSGTSIAGFTDEKTINDSMRMGNLKLNLYYDYPNIDFIEPGATYFLSSSIENTGEIEGQLRVKITPIFAFEDISDLGYFYESGLPTDNVKFNFTPEFESDFTLDVDGYYYYNDTIQSNQKIGIFDSITLDYHQTGNEYQPDNKNTYLVYQIKAETRQVPKSDNTIINGVEVSYNIRDEEWISLESQLEIKGQRIHETSSIPVSVVSMERVGNQIIITFNKNVDNIEFFVESDGPARLFENSIKTGNNIIIDISEEALATSGEYPLSVYTEDMMSLLRQQTFIIQ